MPYVFGPVPSRRLGLSLGVDLIPPKTCTYDCLYCQLGNTTVKTLDDKSFVSVRNVVAEIEKKAVRTRPDVITLAGSGEPTLCSDIHRVIESVKKMGTWRVAVLTNGSLFWRDDIRQRVLDADIILPTLTTASQATFKMIHRPHAMLDLSRIIEGLKKLRRAYKGKLYLEILLLAGINDTAEELEALRAAIHPICPDKIQLNTVVRPPADARARPLDRERLEDIKVFFGNQAEIVTDGVYGRKDKKEISHMETFLDMVKRRPLTIVDITRALGLPLEQAEDLVKGMLMKGRIREQEHSGVVYYVRDEKNVD